MPVLQIRIHFVEMTNRLIKTGPLVTCRLAAIYRCSNAHFQLSIIESPMTFSSSHLKLDRLVAEFDETFDVVVIGFGFAGAVAAIEAHDRGARVLLIEKMPDPGGISICAGGGLRYGVDADAAYAYVKATNAQKTPDDVLRAFADGMVGLKHYLEELASPLGATVEVIHRNANYPFTGFDSFSFVQIAHVPGLDIAREYPHVHGTQASRGTHLFKVLHDNIRLRGIEVRLATPALRLITTPSAEVHGVWVGGEQAPRAIAARQGVVLACGGFEAGTDLQLQYWQFGEVRSAAFLGNTGDAIRMGQDLGADLWHLWHFHGSYGFHHTDPQFPLGIRVKRLPDWTPGVSAPTIPMTWILVDKSGRRFMNEYEPYFQDTGHRALERMDMSTQTAANRPAFLIVDDIGRQKYPLGGVAFNDRRIAPYTWSADNLQEVANGMLKRADSVEQLARIIGAQPLALRESLDLWNAACEVHCDAQWGRPAGAMHTIRHAPFYVGEVWPVVSNTQGGIAHDAQQRVMTVFGEAIDRLYVAGEAGSLWGHLYLVGGNLAECFISGRIAAAHAAASLPWSS
jgi:succinate dehydrogenase/fumarate reductase flavoprotein subunit